jgi:hypothetical protein
MLLYENSLLFFSNLSRTDRGAEDLRSWFTQRHGRGTGGVQRLDTVGRGSYTLAQDGHVLQARACLHMRRDNFEAFVSK